MKRKFDINSQPKGNPFGVPEGYFESLTGRIMANIPDAPATDSPLGSSADTTATVRQPHPQPAQRSRLWLRWTAVAAAACAVGAALFLFPHNESVEPQPHDGIRAAATERTEQHAPTYDETYREDFIQYTLIDNADIYSYLAGIDL